MIVIGHYSTHPVHAVGAVGLSNMLVNLVGNSVISGFTNALDTFVAQSYGAGELKLCTSYVMRGR